MRTVRCIGCGKDVCPGGCLPRGVSAWGVCLPQCMLGYHLGVSAQVHAGMPAKWVSSPVYAGIHTPTPWTEFLTHACEHYLSATTVADGNKFFGKLESFTESLVFLCATVDIETSISCISADFFNEERSTPSLLVQMLP